MLRYPAVGPAPMRGWVVGTLLQPMIIDRQLDRDLPAPRRHVHGMWSIRPAVLVLLGEARAARPPGSGANVHVGFGALCGGSLRPRAPDGGRGQPINAQLVQSLTPTQPPRARPPGSLRRHAPGEGRAGAQQLLRHLPPARAPSGMSRVLPGMNEGELQRRVA